MRHTLFIDRRATSFIVTRPLIRPLQAFSYADFCLLLLFVALSFLMMLLTMYANEVLVSLF